MYNYSLYLCKQVVVCTVIWLYYIAQHEIVIIGISMVGSAETGSLPWGTLASLWEASTSQYIQYYGNWQLFYVFEFCGDHVANKNVLSNLVKRKFIPCASGKYNCIWALHNYILVKVSATSSQ